MGDKQEKVVKVQYYASGRGNKVTRLNIAKSLFEAIGVTEGNSDVKVRVSRGKIIIEKADTRKWDELTEEEKVKFYNKVKSPDGRMIRLQKVEDAKYLWERL